MENIRRYHIHPTGKMNQDFQMDDENRNPVYEAKVLKKGIFTPWQFEFVNRRTNRDEVHKVGHTVTTSQSSGFGGGIIGGIFEDMADSLSKRSSFKFDGKKIWDYLHDQGIRIDSKLAKGRLGMTYRVTLKGKDMATLTMAAPNGKKSLIVGDYLYDVETAEDDLDLTFLTAFAIARTEQTFYD